MSRTYKETLSCDGMGCTETAIDPTDWHKIEIDPHLRGLPCDYCPTCFAEITASGPLMVVILPEEPEKVEEVAPDVDDDDDPLTR